MQNFIFFRHLFVLNILLSLFLFISCASNHETKIENRGELKDFYNDQYYSLVTNTSIRIQPVSSDWRGYRHVDSELEKVSFLVRAALVEVNNTCGDTRRPKILGKPKILLFKEKKHLGPIGVEVDYKCLKR